MLIGLGRSMKGANDAGLGSRICALGFGDQGLGNQGLGLGAF